MPHREGNKRQVVTLNPAELNQLENFACQMADEAAKITLEFFRSHIEIEDKSCDEAFDPVTMADRKAEKIMRTLIETTYPKHGIIGEEHDNKNTGHALSWVLDPIDGTRSYITGVPLWGTLIGLGAEGVPFLGVMDQPYLKERYIGINTSERREARLISTQSGSRTLHTRPCSALSQATLTCTTPHMFNSGAERAAYEAVEAKCRLTRYSLDCYGYTLLAMGLFDVVIEANMAQYDIFALIPLIEAAGGIITDWNGNPAHKGGQVIAAGNRTIHAQALDILRPAAT